MYKKIKNIAQLIELSYDTGMDMAYNQGSRNLKSCLLIAEDFMKSYGLEGLRRRHGAFVDKAFPDITDWRAPLKHMQEEVKECIESGDEEEFSDLLLLALSAFRLKFPGKDAIDLIKMAHAKMDINEKRKWGDKEVGGFRKHIK